MEAALVTSLPSQLSRAGKKGEAWCKGWIAWEHCTDTLQGRLQESSLDASSCFMSWFVCAWVCLILISSRIETQTHSFHSAGLVSQCLGLGPILKLLLFNKKGGGWLKYKYLEGGRKNEEEKKKKEVEKRHECLMQQKKKPQTSLMLLLCQLGLLAVEVVIGSGS